MGKNKVFAAVVAASMLSVGCGASDAGSAENKGVGSSREALRSSESDCVAYLDVDGQAYWGTQAHELPLGQVVGSGELPVCDEQGGDGGGATEVELYRIPGIDPEVAVGVRGEGGATDQVWVAFDGTPAPEQIPDSLRRYVVE